MTLALHGVATSVRGYGAAATPRPVRLRETPEGLGPADLFIARSAEDLERAKEAGASGVIFIGALPAESGETLAPRFIVMPPQFGYLGNGDIIGIRPETRRFRTLYRRASPHNSFLVTERCNHYCVMCSQPPRDVDDSWILDEIRAAIPLVDRSAPAIGFTGGEPLLDWTGFIGVLQYCRHILPDTALQVLTNGRAFAASEVASAWAAVKHPDLTACIPIYSAVDHVHDYVVQAQGAFEDTVLGILKMKDRGQRVEIRVVLHAVTAPRIVETARWLARNLPFVDHVALMGLENTGFAIANDELLWIDPLDYRDLLAEAVGVLASAQVNVSIYNLQRCVLARSVWSFAAKSISDWKNNYIKECSSCSERERCAGFFSSGRPRYSRGIHRIL
jgi:His-Xaa-Ser system radical SAM maturase HxsC